MLIFEKSRPGRGCSTLPACDVEVVRPKEKDRRELKLHMPELSEVELSRHYTELAKVPWRERWILSAWILYHEVQPKNQ